MSEPASRNRLGWALLLILVVNLPALWVGWVMDDAIHHEMVTGTTADLHRDWQDLYCFAGGPHGLPASRFDPWWKTPHMNGCFFRPLASVTLALDHWLLAGHPALAHVHALLWFLLATSAIYVLGARLFDRRVAVLACVLYGLAGYGGIAVGWLAARHSLITAALSGWGLTGYVVGRQSRRALPTALGIAGLGIALLSGEGALGGFAFVAAYELFCSRDPLRRRLLHAGAATAVVLAFVLFYTRSGYGTPGVGGYLDPAHHPKEFLLALPGRLLCLLGDAVLGSPSGLWGISNKQPLLVGMGVLGLSLLAGCLALSPDRADDQRARSLRFLAAGALLAAIPGAAAILGGRVLMLPAVGLSLVFAVALRPWPAALRSLRGGRRLAAVLVVGGFALGALVLNPLSRVAQILVLRQLAQREQVLQESSLLACRNAESVFFLGTDDIAVGMHGPYLLKEHLVHKQWLQLSLATADMELTRPDPRTIRLQSQQALVIGGALYEMMRAEHSAIPAGTRIELPPATLYIETALSQGVRSLRLELPISTDDPRTCWLRYDGAQLIPVTLPPVGTATTIQYARGPMSR